eukprot:SAG11_NODE_36130_length_263_cov_0.634146_1_plen_34_part_10
MSDRRKPRGMRGGRSGAAREAEEMQAKRRWRPTD